MNDLNKSAIILTTIALSFGVESCVPLAVGTAGIVAAEATSVAMEDRSLGEVVDDTTIWASIKKAFADRGYKKLFTNIHVEVKEGRVMLTGEVDSYRNIRQAIDIVWSREGVREVINELKVSRGDNNKVDIEQYAIDSIVTGKIKAKLLLEKDIKSTNYTIVTEHNVVYVFGIASSKREVEKVMEVAKGVKGAYQVVNHTRIKGVKENVSGKRRHYR